MGITRTSLTQNTVLRDNALFYVLFFLSLVFGLMVSLFVSVIHIELHQVAIWEDWEVLVPVALATCFSTFIFIGDYLLKKIGDTGFGPWSELGIGVVIPIISFLVMWYGGSWAINPMLDEQIAMSIGIFVLAVGVRHHFAKTCNLI